MVQFYSITDKKSVDVPSSKISVRKTKNGKLQLVGIHGGKKVYKFCSAQEAKKYQ